MKDLARTSIFERQWIHAALLLVMVVGLWFVARACPCFHRGSLWGIGTWTWFWIAVEIAIARQVCIWVHYFTTERPDMRWIYRPS